MLQTASKQVEAMVLSKMAQREVRTQVLSRDYRLGWLLPAEQCNEPDDITFFPF